MEDLASAIKIFLLINRADVVLVSRKAVHDTELFELDCFLSLGCWSNKLY